MASHEPACSGLLHNMSAPPKSVVKYSGLTTLASKPSAGALGAIDSGAVVLRFALPAGFTDCSASEVLQRMGVEPGHAASAQLAALLDVRANALALPSGCAVLAVQASHRVIWSDPLSVLAVLAKCSDTLWLRDKSPSLISAFKRRQASLRVPALFVPHLPKVDHDIHHNGTCPIS